MNKKRSIGIVAPSNSMSVIDTKLIEIGLKNLKNIGFNVNIHSNAYNTFLGSTASIKDRLESIDDFLEDKEIDIIMSAIGGYGANQLLPYLDFNKIKEKKKLFIGYSDFTPILNMIYVKTGLKTILGPSFVSFCNPNYNWEMYKYFFEAIENFYGQNDKVELISPKYYAYDTWHNFPFTKNRDLKKHQGWKFLREGTASAYVLGGNCDALLSLSGTKYFPTINNRILLLEGVANQNIDKIIRELFQLKQMNVFENLSGLIIGKYDDNLKLLDLKTCVLNILYEYDFPIVSNINFSHVDPLYSLILGSKVTIDSTKKTIYYSGK